jgi:hypothetical protein
MPADFKPNREADLVGFTTNFSNQLSAKFELVGRSAADASTFADLNSAWVSAYNTANEPSTRTPPAIQGKNAAKAACVDKLRELVGLIQKFRGTTDALRRDFGLPIRKKKTPIPIPSNIPTAEVVKRYGQTVVVRLHDGSRRRAKPTGVAGARVYTFVGTSAPTDPGEWFFERQATTTEVTLHFDASLAPGTKVWITAQWYNPRGQVGQASPAISTVLAGGTTSLAGGSIHLAA